MKIFYIPFKMVGGMIGSKLGKNVFKQLWGTIDDGEPPKPTTLDATYSKVVGAATLEAATLSGVAAVVDRATAKTFHYFTGFWPGEQKAEDSEDSEKDKDSEKEK